MKREYQKTEKCNAQDTNSTGRDAGRLLLLGILVGLILVNTAQFVVIDYNAYLNYKAIKSYGTADLAEIGRNHAGPVPQARTGPYFALAQVAPNVELLLPLDSPFTAERLYGLGQARSIVTLPYDADMFCPEFDPDNYKVADIAGSEKLDVGVTAIILGQEEPETLIFLRRNQIWYMVDTTLLPKEAIEELTK